MLVKQEHRDGCQSAVLAMLTGHSYAEIYSAWGEALVQGKIRMHEVAKYLDCTLVNAEDPDTVHVGVVSVLYVNSTYRDQLHAILVDTRSGATIYDPVHGVRSELLAFVNRYTVWESEYLGVKDGSYCK